ncbi:MAG: TonB-dependent receptor [Acidobacteria bacterium]|nr:TonB-dependent receptor [Acidobacteriota bacterium]
METKRILLALLLATAAAGQVERGRITGSVTDQSGGVIPKARVTITNTQTNISYATETDEQGRYESPPLQVGQYQVAVERSGFKRVVRKGIVLEIQETAVVNLTLEVGAVTEQVSVTADAPLLNTTEATQGQVIDNKKIVDLPLNGRDYIQLALISSGTNYAAPGARTRGFSGSGMRATQNNYLLDGLDNNNYQIATQGRQGETVKPGVDAIQEFKVMTNSFSAEYGKATGAVVNVTLKSGTNELHGTAFEFLRNEKLDAKNLFDPPNRPRAPFKRNQYGFSVGGPVKHNKTFFFGDYEATRIRETSTFNNTIPTQRMVAGDFSELLPERIYDPATYNAATRERQPFPGNLIPASRFDPIGAKLAKLYPAPNKPGLTQNFLHNPPNQEDRDRWDVKIDHSFGASDSIYGRFSYQRDNEPGSAALPPPAFGGGGATDFQHDGRNFMIAYNRIFTPALIMSVKAGWNRMFTDREPPVSTNINKDLGLTGVNLFLAGMGQFNLSGYQALGLGPQIPNLIDSQVRQLIVDLTWIRNRHTLKFGTNLSWLQAYLANPQQALGVFSFDNGFTRNPQTLREGNAAADLLLGTPNQAQVATPSYFNQRAPYYDLYVQDEWRVSRRLTLNFGVRYELHLPWVETRNGWANFDIDTDPANPALVLAQDGSRYSRATIRSDGNNFGPRFGFAFAASNGTVVRGGYGVYYANYEPFGGAEYLETNPPFLYRAVISTDRITPTILLRRGLPPDAIRPQNASNLQTSSYERNGRLPYAQQWSLSIQRELPGQMVFEIGYYANAAHKLLRRNEGNWALPGPGNINSRRRYRSILVPRDNVVVGPLAGTFRHEWNGNSNFHSLQTRLEKRLSHGLSLLMSYSWSKTISDSRGASGAGGVSNILPQNPLNLAAERALADEHRPHRFVASYVYDLPLGRGKSYLSQAPVVVDAFLGGWSVAGITTLASGRLINLSVTGNPSNTGGPDRPNVLHDWRLSSDERSTSRWFDTSAFALNAPFTFGNAGRNLIEGPGEANFDFAVYKYFSITESTRLQFRAEAFNLFNTPPLGPPNAQVGNRNFGQIAGAGRPRNLQLGLKLIF